MRLHRLLLRDFRGVGTLEVVFDPAGVTIVEGRNEIGKTSLADAFQLLPSEFPMTHPLRVRALLFDLDGTLVDTEDQTDQAIQTVVARHGVA